VIRCWLLTGAGFRIPKLEFPIHAVSKFPLRFVRKFHDVLLKILHGMPLRKYLFDSGKPALANSIRYQNANDISYVE
jgi:hypothetical protein